MIKTGPALAWLKDRIEELPEWVGRWVGRVPYKYKLGRRYTAWKSTVQSVESAPDDVRERWIWDRLTEYLSHCYREIPFYRRLLEDRGLVPDDVGSWDEWSDLPILSKEQLRGVALEDRSCLSETGLLLNTGGTSGEPLHFYLDGEAFAREWAHIHRIWKRVGYTHEKVKLTLRGNYRQDRPAWYNPVHNEIQVNAYSRDRDVVAALQRMSGRYDIRYIHGYPSQVAEFARSCEAPYARSLKTTLRESVEAVLLGSEFPAPVYRDRIKSAFGARILTWYGHSEMAILAEEIDRGVYSVLPSYGLAEAVPDPEGNGWRLVGTSFSNLASPFVRYDTGDRIVPLEVEGARLTKFRIRHGRVGEYVTDKHGERISLTALVFGRHHEVFDWADHVQVRQEKAGSITVVVTAEGGVPPDRSVSADFDATNVALDVEFEVRESPVRTESGKVALLIRES